MLLVFNSLVREGKIKASFLFPKWIWVASQPQKDQWFCLQILQLSGDNHGMQWPKYWRKESCTWYSCASKKCALLRFRIRQKEQTNVTVVTKQRQILILVINGNASRNPSLHLNGSINKTCSDYKVKASTAAGMLICLRNEGSSINLAQLLYPGIFSVPGKHADSCFHLTKELSTI